MKQSFTRNKNMKGVYKKYDPKLAKEADHKARTVFKYWLKSFGYTDSEIIEMENPDFLIENRYYVEVELSDCWNATKFPENEFPSFWHGAHVLERKGKNKFFSNGQNKKCFFVMFRSDLKKAIIIPDDYVQPDRLIDNPNKYRREGDEKVFLIKHGEYIFRDVENEINKRKKGMLKKDWRPQN